MSDSISRGPTAQTRRAAAPTVLFRTEAGPVVGLGHLQRSLSLAAALAELGLRSYFCTNDEPQVLTRVRAQGFDGCTATAAEPWGEDDASRTAARAAELGSVAMVIDADRQTEEYLVRLRESGVPLCSVIDRAPHAFPSQLVIGGDADAADLEIKSTFGDTQFLLGPRYMILRPEFWDVSPPAIAGQARHVLLTLGGADPFDLTPALVTRLASETDTSEITVIVGPFFRNRDRIDRAAEGGAARVTTVTSPDTVRELMDAADLAVSGGGQTLYELARVGCPALALRFAANQDAQLAIFEERGFLRRLGDPARDGVVDAAVRSVRALAGDTAARAAMARAGRTIVDGGGALRAARAIAKIAAPHTTESGAAMERRRQ